MGAVRERESTLETQIDELYQLPLSEFTAARNALAKSLKGGERDRVKHLQKPTAVAWTVNQLFWRARPVYDRVVESGARLRAAQIAALKGRAADVRTIAADHRAVVGEAVRTATALARSQDVHVSDDLARMLEALSLAAKTEDHPGRFTVALQPSGFEALAGITPAGAAAPSATPHRAATTHTPAPAADEETGNTRSARPSQARGRLRLVTSTPAPRPDPSTARQRAAAERQRAAAERERIAEERRREKAAAAARARAEAAVAAAERDLARATQALARAEDAVATARHDVEDAERNLAAARAHPVLSSSHV